MNLQQYLLSSPPDKTSLTGYCFRRWKGALSAILLEEDVTYLAELNGSTKKITMNQSLSTSLVCDDKEADSKMFVYCKTIKDLHNIERIVVYSPDTDFAVICCYHQLVKLSLRKLWFKTGAGKYKRFIPIHNVVTKLGQSTSKLILACYSIIRCEPVNSFAAVGKKTATSILKLKLENLVGLENFRNEPALSLEHDAVVACIKFVCSLYDQGSNGVFNINDVRFKVGLSRSKKFLFICFNESSLKLMNNDFYFILKTLFVLEIVKFLY